MIDDLVAAFEASRDPERAAPMAAYMRDQFAFLGISSPARRSLQRAVFAQWMPTQQELRTFARACWRRPEREYQYAACDVLGKHVKRCGPELLADLRWLVTHKSWWDTVDALAGSVGALVHAHAELKAEMDRWIDDDDFWVARVAILHQLKYKTATDTDRLFGYCARRAADGEFFVRKAIGWALREYSKTDPAAVVQFCAAHPELSGLSRREALRRIT